MPFVTALLLVFTSDLAAALQRRNSSWTVDPAAIAQHCEYAGSRFNASYAGAPACARYLASEAFYVPSSQRPPSGRLLFHMFWSGPFTEAMLVRGWRGPWSGGMA